MHTHCITHDAYSIAYQDDFSEHKSHRNTYPSVHERVENHTLQSALGRRALAHALTTYAKAKGISASLVSHYTYSRSISGRPLLTHPDHNAPVLSVSIAHTKHVAIASITTMKEEGFIGIDAEYVRVFDPKVINRFCTKQEMSSIQNIDSVTTTLLWCLKEAYLKAIGTGLRTDPLSIEFLYIDTPRYIHIRHNDTIVPAHISWTFFQKNCILTRITIHKEHVPNFVF